VLLAVFIVLLALFVVLPILGLALWAIISAIVVGAVIGALARLILPGRATIGVPLTIVLGWIGSMIGGYLGEQVWDLSGFPTVLIEIGIAAVLIGVWSSADQLARR
jgi:uncharacterized membrane protein YeaQ/YmgE (transglycosylase-associated protein family)